MRTASALLLAVALTACAPTRPGSGDTAPASRPAERRCFSVSQVDNFRQGGAGLVYLRVRGDGVYRVEAAGACTDLDGAYRLALVPDSGGSVGSRVCAGDWARIVVPGSTSPASACRVRIDRRLSEEEVAALPDAHRP